MEKVKGIHKKFEEKCVKQKNIQNSAM